MTQTATITLGLLETDTLAEARIPDYGSYGRMFARYFDALDGQLGYRYYQVQDGELPQQPGECDAYLITGSEAGVYDTLPWLEPLRAWIVDFYARGARLIGICFGHQMIAHSLGGRAGKSAKGWGLGVLASQVRMPAGDAYAAFVGGGACATVDGTLGSTSAELRLIHSHQDQVELLPPGARVLAASEFCPYAAYAIDAQVLAFQGHPEFTPGYFRRLFADADGNPDAARLDAALATLDQPTDHAAVGRMLLACIRGRSG